MSLLLALLLSCSQGDARTLQALEARVAADPDDRHGAWELAYLYWRLERFEERRGSRVAEEEATTS